MDRRQNNGSVKAVSLRHCPATSALCNCCFNCRAGQSHKDNVRCTAVEEQPETKEVHLWQPSSTSLYAHDLFWANLRVQLRLPPLDLSWNPECGFTPSQQVRLYQGDWQRGDPQNLYMW